jgi:hypothetical protein
VLSSLPIFSRFCFLVSPVLTILPALIPSLPPVLYLPDSDPITNLCLPLSLPAVLCLIDSDPDYGPLPTIDRSFACPPFESINICDSSRLHLGLILSSDT